VHQILFIVFLAIVPFRFTQLICPRVVFVVRELALIEVFTLGHLRSPTIAFLLLL
jgi:hypothetical protein